MNFDALRLRVALLFYVQFAKPFLCPSVTIMLQESCAMKELPLAQTLGRHPIYAAASKGHKGCLALLLEAGCDKNTTLKKV